MTKTDPSQAGFWGPAAAVLAADQLTKWLVFRASINSLESNVLPGVFFRLERSGNVGIAWGLLRGWPGLVFVAGVVAAIAVVYYYYRHARRSRAEAAALGMVLGGAIGNLIDRAVFGQVRDFLAFRIGGYHWPTFNIADSFISMGAILLVLLFLLSRPHKEPDTVQDPKNDRK